ncbi:ImmA/IrrE family metallo-endopeptidase [Microbacterium sp. MEC084]|uniref:ImmA/IrrE family metallo-endopeptidase n=1 Tax=Microbacterium sp. MEC084 TaxID=1963027 RepID=UPI00106F1757|nr:ImmA/IrrE family metallo-endopeptidase [Microbacterium sp. MEC084]MCD1269892.1 ImmA/IrrE family metallo-endopeptidase [Microbacterium sp. MEC084]
MSAHVAIAPSILRWAEAYSQRDHVAFLHRFPQWDDWAAGRRSPTIRQVEQIASFSHLPFGIFFLAEPPELQLPIPDYRLGTGGDARTPSPELREVIDESVFRQDWYRDYSIREGLAPPQLPQLTRLSTLAGEIRDALDFSVSRRAGLPRDQVRRRLKRSVEELGVLVTFAGTITNNTQRTLSREEFRGFTLYDRVAPLIFVNTHDDTKTGQIFTLIHELGHVLRRESALDEPSPRHDGADAEGWCNRLAAEVLVPTDDLRQVFRSDADLYSELDRLASRYVASTPTILLQLRAIGAVPRDGFDEVYRRVEERARAAAKLNDTSTDGGNYYANLPYRVGERLSRAVITDARSGATSLTDAMRLLGLSSTSKIDRYAQEVLHL